MLFIFDLISIIVELLFCILNFGNTNKLHEGFCFILLEKLRAKISQIYLQSKRQ